MGEGMVAGIDWASEVHVACVMDGHGAVTSRFSFTRDAAAIGVMAGRLRAAGVAGVAIERGDGPVVEALMAAGLAVFVVPSRQIKGLRSRYGSAGNKDDRFDAYVLADTLRTDGHRWKPLRPDCDPTRALRALCRSRKDLVETRVAILGQLRANLELAFPGAIGLFTKPYSAISLAFLQRFPTAAKAAWLSPKRLASWLSSVGYTGGVSAEIRRLTGPEILTRAEAARALGVHPATVARRAAAGILASFRTPSGERRYHRCDVEALINQRGLADGAPSPEPVHKPTDAELTDQHGPLDLPRPTALSPPASLGEDYGCCPVRPARVAE
jgi:transposase